MRRARAVAGDFRRLFAESAAPSTGFVKMHSPAPMHFQMGASEQEAGASALALLEDQILMEGPETVAAAALVHRSNPRVRFQGRRGVQGSRLFHRRRFSI